MKLRNELLEALRTQGMSVLGDESMVDGREGIFTTSYLMVTRGGPTERNKREGKAELEG